MQLSSLDSIRAYSETLQQYGDFADADLLSSALKQCKEGFKSLDCGSVDSLLR